MALLIGAGFVLIGLRALWAYRPHREDRSKWPLVQGRIVDVYEPPDPDGHVINQPKVAFRTLEGDTVEAWARNRTYDIRRRIGGRIDVHYKPGEPQTFWVDAGPDAMQPAGWIGALAALLFLAIGIGLVVFNLS